jgi:hypothetical protein
VKGKIYPLGKKVESVESRVKELGERQIDRNEQKKKKKLFVGDF